MDSNKEIISTSQKISSSIKEILPYLIILVIVILLKIFLLTTIRVYGTSMSDTLHPNDILLLDKVSYRFSDIKRWDIVVIKFGDEKIIKRVVGLPGEHISYKDNNLYVGDEKIIDNYGNGKTYDFDLNHINLETIPDDCYFVLGDNREESMDSRIIGVINKKDIMGKAFFTIFPFNHIGVPK